MNLNEVTTIPLPGLPRTTAKLVDLHPQGKALFGNVNIEVDGWGSEDMIVPLTKAGKLGKAGKDRIKATVEGMRH